MSIKVTPHGDGSYTVSCEGVNVVVGRSKAARPAPNTGDTDAPDSGSIAGPIIWPDDPETNDGGVYAYLSVSPFAPKPPFARRAGRRPQRLLLDSPLALSQFLELALQSEHASRNRQHDRRCVRVMLEALPEQAIDLNALIEQLRPLAKRVGLRIELHIVAQSGLASFRVES